MFVVPLFDHLIGSCQEGRWDRQPEGLGGLEVDEYFVPSRLFHGKVTGLRALEDLDCVRSPSFGDVLEAWAERQQRTIHHSFAKLMDRGESHVLSKVSD